MSSTLSPGYDMANTLSAQMASSQLHRRNSRSSGSQSGHRPSRVEKPRSNHNSPRVMERRKTTSGTRKYATLDDHYNMMFGITGDEEVDEDRKEASRPMSWHPSSTQFHVPSRSSVMVEQTPALDWSRHHSASSRNSAHGSDYYSLSARSSMLPEQLPNHQAPAHDVHRGSQDSDSSWQSHPTSAYALSAFSTPATEPMPWYLQEWARKNQQGANSRNGSADFLPIQHPTTNDTEEAVEDEDMEDTEDAGKELVGMGLYDLPEPALSWNSSSLVEGTGKGLKLEETWQPPEDEDDEENEEEEQEADDASSDDGSVEELPTAKETTQLPIHNVKPQIPGNMDGQSFFFDEDESYTKEWWFQQLKQPSMPVRDAGLGYGWL